VARGSRSTRRIASTARHATSRTRPRISTGWSRKAAEAPITRTCRQAGLIALFLLAPAGASANVADQSGLAAYVRARAAGSGGALEASADSYAAALALSPDNDVLAARTLAQALAAGNQPLALRATHILARVGKLPIEGRLLLLGEAFRRRDWKGADLQVDGIQKDEVFAFLAPMLRAWSALGARKGDPIAPIRAIGNNPLASSYADEPKAMILLATGKEKDGLETLQPILDEGGMRAERLRIAAAASLAARGRKAEALALLDGESAAQARARVGAGKAPGPAIATPAEGAAELLLRIAVDLNAQQVPDAALRFARIATFLAPANSEGWLLTAELLAGAGQNEAALAALQRVAGDDPFASRAAQRRLSILVEAGRGDEALARARAATNGAAAGVEAWVRYAYLLAQTGRNAEAADDYGRALSVYKEGASPVPLWSLHLLRGNVLTQAGKWAEAKESLEQAYKLAPRQPVVLNFLGYSQLERRENLAEAEKLIQEASRLQPDDAAITDSLGWVHYVRGNLPQAIELLERAARGQPADPAINEHLGDAYYSAGRHYEARYAWRAALVYADGKAAVRLKGKIDTGLSPELAAP
jgi:Flp pilus assembly protein TadD